MKERMREAEGMMPLVCAVAAQTVLMVTLTIMLISLPDIQSALGISDAEKTWVVIAYTLPYGALVLFGGRMVQRFGSRSVFLSASCGFALASLVGAMALSSCTLIMARVFQGIFAALLAPANLSLVSTSYSDAGKRTRAFAIMGGTGGAGAALGLVLGGF